MIYRAREGNTGILYLTDAEGKENRFIPDYDLDKARELLLEFQELKDARGKSIKDNYWREGYNWFPTTVSYLYWHVFFVYVKYKPLVDQALDKKIGFQFENKADLYRVVAVLEGEETGNKIKMMMFRTLVRLNNWLVVRLFPVELLFFRFSMDDFRSVEIRKTLDELGAAYIQVVPPGRLVDIVSNILRMMPYYYYGGISSRKTVDHQYDFNGLDKYKKHLFERAAHQVDRMISAYVKEYKIHLRRLENTRLKIWYGFDDSNGYIFPLLYACQQRGIKTIGHQHGAYVRRHASYVMEGIEKGSYKWFDKVIVWGDYWKDHLLKISSVYSPDMLVVGSNKVKWGYGSGQVSHSMARNILLPYEFATNTFRVGKYVAKLIDLGYIIFFKPRKDERLEDQLAAYCLSPEHLAKLHIVEEIDTEFMKTIDIIAGTMTTLVYELMPYNKIIWVFDTEYRHLEDLVEEGYAHKIKYEDLEELDERYFVRTKVNASYFFSPETLYETLSKHLLEFGGEK